MKPKMKNFPDAIVKRDILHGHKKMSDSAKLALGAELASEGWLSDAIDFLATDPQQLEAVKKAAVAEGNVFLLLKAFRSAGKEDSNQLLEATQQAEALGKLRYAIKGYEKLESSEKVAELKAKISEDGDMKTALNDVFIPKSEEEREEE